MLASSTAPSFHTLPFATVPNTRAGSSYSRTVLYSIIFPRLSRAAVTRLHENSNDLSASPRARRWPDLLLRTRWLLAVVFTVPPLECRFRFSLGSGRSVSVWALAWSSAPPSALELALSCLRPSRMDSLPRRPAHMVWCGFCQQSLLLAPAWQRRRSRDSGAPGGEAAAETMSAAAVMTPPFCNYRRDFACSRKTSQNNIRIHTMFCGFLQKWQTAY